MASNVDLFKAFVLRVVQAPIVPVCLIGENLKVHHAKCLKAWFAELAKTNNFRIHYLP